MSSKCVVVEGFTVIPIQFSQKYDSCHYLYCKPHTARTADQHTPKERTLFVIGVPPYCGEVSLNKIFSVCGKVDRIILTTRPSMQPNPEETSKFFPNEAMPQSFKVAYVVFKNSKSMKKAAAMSHSQPLLISTEDCKVKTGMAKWRAEYRQAHNLDTKELQADIDEFMAGYDAKVEEEERREKEMDGVPDEDGWITVTKTGKYKGVPRTEAEQERTKAKEKKKRKDKELLNFYTFQIRESKRERIADLRKKFEEDKQKIAQLRASRRFRPF